MLSNFVAVFIKLAGHGLFFFFNLNMVNYIDFPNAEPALHSRGGKKTSTLSGCIILSYVLVNSVCSCQLGIFESMFMKGISLLVSF